MATPRRFKTHRRWLLLALVLVSLAVPSGWAQAEASPQPAAGEPCPTCLTTDEHRSGVYLRMSAGITSLQLHTDYGTANKVGGSVSFAFGYYILPNLALSLGGYGSNAYKFEVPTRTPGETVELDARMLCLGVSLTYYFPYEFYLAVAPGMGWVLETFEGGDSKMNDAGFALDVLAGKEWWMQGTWTLGVGMQFSYTVAEGEIAAVDYVWALGVLFTVSWN
jgi:Outer membrane protein beta-barrel domain